MAGGSPPSPPPNPNQPTGPPPGTGDPWLPVPIIVGGRHGDPQMTVQEKAEAEGE